MKVPLVALVGRPNVGKSTLFNRLIGQRLAIVQDEPGTTRDRLYGRADWAGYDFAVVDTGGLETEDAGPLAIRVRNQALVAVEEADVVVFIVDAITGLTPSDQEIADLLRRSGRPIVLAANKAERKDRQEDAGEFWSLGIGEPHPLSALHGYGSGDLLDTIVAKLPAVEAGPEETRLQVAIVGRPNVGKSSILNRLTGSERSVVSEEPGTTRDAIDSNITVDGEEIVLVDTAGIRRRGKIEPGIEQYSVLRARRALERSDVAVLVLDADAGITAQDAHIGGYVDEAGVGAIIAVNKWDLVEKETNTAMLAERALRAELKFLDHAPLVFVSALSGQRIRRLITLAMEIRVTRKLRVPTSALNRFTADLVARHPLTSHGRALKIRYATQAAIEPPLFIFFVNDVRLVHFTYRRYIENRLREEFGFEGTAIRLAFRDQQEAKD